MNEQYILDSQTKSFVTTHCTCYAEQIWLLKVCWKHSIFVMAPFFAARIATKAKDKLQETPHSVEGQKNCQNTEICKSLIARHSCCKSVTGSHS